MRGPRPPVAPLAPLALQHHQLDPAPLGGSLLRWMYNLKNGIIRQEVLLDGSQKMDSLKMHILKTFREPPPPPPRRADATSVVQLIKVV